MTVSEAFTLLESALEDLGLRDKSGDLIPYPLIAGVVGKKIGEDWYRCIDDLATGKIDISEYLNRMLGFTKEYSAHAHSRRIRERIASLKLDQAELDLI